MSKYPNRCSQCDAPITYLTSSHCLTCSTKQPASTTTIAAYQYQFPVDQLIAQFKYNKDLATGRMLAHIAALQIQQRLSVRDGSSKRPHLLVPVPLHHTRERKRGFNQAHCLTKDLSKRLNIPYNSTLCTRIRATRPQSECTQAERKHNVIGAFEINQRTLSKVLCNHAKPHIAIVDDVITTGTTTNTLAQQFLDAGIDRVDLYCIAKTL